jgi:hypothetical protein
MEVRMTRLLFAGLLVIAWAAAAAPPAAAQNREKGPWWPHPIWGPEDQAGGSNWITPDKILEAVSLVKTGKVYELGHVYERGMPLIGKRTFAMLVPSSPTHGPLGEARIVFNDEFLCAEIGQVGTQFDGPGHVGRRMTMADGSTADVYYNGVASSEMHDPYGLAKLGVERVKPILTRGVLVDVAGYRGVETLPNGYEVTLADVRGALARQQLAESDIRPGDALLFNFGWWRLWPDPARVNAPAPGVGPEVAAWIVERRVSMVGSDTTTDVAMAVHQKATLENGIFNLEWMRFEDLLADRAYEFLFVFTPLRLKGATGSPGRPLAIR